VGSRFTMTYNEIVAHRIAKTHQIHIDNFLSFFLPDGLCYTIYQIDAVSQN